MTDVVYLLGAGFNRSALSSLWDLPAPLARDFFQHLFGSAHFKCRLQAASHDIFLDELLAYIKRYWNLDRSDLETLPFDIEECMTLLESQLSDEPSSDTKRAVELRRAMFALRSALPMYLGDLSVSSLGTATSARFAADVLEKRADILTFNYDTIAEQALERASGGEPKPNTEATTRWTKTDRSMRRDATFPDDDLDVCPFEWNRALSYGFRFGEVTLSLAGISPTIDGHRYYKHPQNRLYESHRVLKLHGSISWLKYGYPTQPHGAPFAPPDGIVLHNSVTYSLGRPPERNGWLMEPIIIPPQLYKKYESQPFPAVWQAALESLRECQTLIVVGYSFPPTDFRTRRLFLEAFADHSIQQLIVINPDPSIVGVVQKLTRFDGPVIACDNLRSYYGT